MPPKDASRLDEIPPTATLPLQDWLKLLNSRGVDMRVAMSLAAKMYNSHNTKERLEELDAKKLMTVIPDKDARRTVVAAVKGISSGPSYNKKRTRDSDLMQPLQEEKDEVPESLDFHPITDPEKLIPISITTNRAPVKTAWAYTVALRMGFDTQEALSIAHVYVHLSSMRHALKLGNIYNKEETREAEDELAELPGADVRVGSSKDTKRGWNGRGRRGANEERSVVGSSQPWVGILRAKPVIERPDGTWRAIQKGVPVQPSIAYLYITRAFKNFTPHVMGSLQLLANSYPPEELNVVGMHMYNSFKPDVVEWGQKATLECAKILDQLKQPLSDMETMARKEEESSAQNSGQPSSAPSAISPGPSGQAEDIKPVHTHVPSDGVDIPDTSSELSEPPSPSTQAVLPVDEDDQPAAKKRMTLEEYEAMLDAENDEGGFLEGGDIPSSEQ